jgi:hypothetical protein
LAYRTLAIKKGGVFSGQAELLPAAAKRATSWGLSRIPLLKQTEQKITVEAQ